MSQNLDFAFAREPHVRRHGPMGYGDYSSYRPWLRDEFRFRCLLCLLRETWVGGHTSFFAIDHLKPQATNPELETVYENLVYLCARCNGRKSALEWVDPCAEAIGDHFELQPNGTVKGLTAWGCKAVRRLKLDVDPSKSEQTAQRCRALTLAALASRFAELTAEQQAVVMEWFRYPLDMPDLRTKQPPGGNSIAGSDATCFEARRLAGDLPPIY